MIETHNRNPYPATLRVDRRADGDILHYIRDVNIASRKGNEMIDLCDKNCNECPIINHPNSRMLTKIFNDLLDISEDEVYRIVQSYCPNLTCCYDCRIDDFCHFEGCKIVGDAQ